MGTHPPFGLHGITRTGNRRTVGPLRLMRAETDPVASRRRLAKNHTMPATPLHDPTASPQPGASTETKNTACYMCACRCGIRVHLRDGEVRYIEGNLEHPLNKGVICAKGASGIMKQVSPARLTRPLRRKKESERGAGECEPISWEEAFSILENRLKKIRGTDP